MKSLDYCRIELPASPIVEFFRCCLVRLGGTIHTIACDRVECVSDCEDPRTDVDLFTTQSDWIAGPIPLFMMLRNHARCALQELNAAQNLLPVKWMLAHANPLFLGELRRLAQDRIRH